MKSIGTRFECWIAELFRDLRYRDVQRNVTYSNECSKRQIDVQYRHIVLPQTTIVECKYSSEGPIRLNHRGVNSQKKGKKRTIENIVEEVSERKEFVRAHKAVIASNTFFAPDLQEEAWKYDIALLDARALDELDKKREVLKKLLPWYQPKSIDEQILDMSILRENHYLVL